MHIFATKYYRAPRVHVSVSWKHNISSHPHSQAASCHFNKYIFKLPAHLEGDYEYASIICIACYDSNNGILNRTVILAWCGIATSTTRVNHQPYIHIYPIEITRLLWEEGGVAMYMLFPYAINSTLSAHILHVFYCTVEHEWAIS